MQLFQEGKLPLCTDGRLSAGPLDLPAFLAQVQPFPSPLCMHCPPASPQHPPTHCSLPLQGTPLTMLAQQL